MKKLLLLLLLSGSLIAAPIEFAQAQDPKPAEPTMIRLSDGRLVPGPSGVICAEECARAAAESLPDSPRSKRGLMLGMSLVSAGILIAVLCCPSVKPPAIIPPTGLLPPVSLPPAVPVPEAATGNYVFLILLLFAGSKHIRLFVRLICRSF